MQFVKYDADWPEIYPKNDATQAVMAKNITITACIFLKPPCKAIRYDLYPFNQKASTKVGNKQSSFPFRWNFISFANNIRGNMCEIDKNSSFRQIIATPNSIDVVFSTEIGCASEPIEWF